MSVFKKMGTTYAADCVTGERMNIDDKVLDTGYSVKDSIWLRKTRTRFIKEATLVELVEKAGWKICECGESKSNDVSVGVSSLAPRVVNSDVGVGAGEAEAGEDSLGGSKPVKRRSTRASKGE